MKNKFICFILLVFSAVFFSKNALAEDVQNNKGFSMNPFFQEITLNPDQSKSDFPLEVSNDTSSPAVFKLSVIDFGALDESGGVAFLGSSENLTNKYGLASWVSLEKDAIVINPGETQSIKVSIENKESLSPGGHYAAIMAKLENDNNDLDEKKSKIALQPSFASLIFVRKVGGEIYGLNLKDFELRSGTFNLSEKVYLRFQNTGNVHVAPRGIVKITDPLGREVSQGIINNESALILPETFRSYPVSLKKTAFAFMPGRYKFSIEYRYDGKNDFLVKEEYVDFVPMPAILTGLIILGSAAAYGAFRTRKKRKIRKNINSESFKKST